MTIVPSRPKAGARSPKLTRAQLAVLTAAADRDDHLVAPSGPKAGVRRRPILSLLSQGLLVEVASLPGQAHWRIGDDGAPVSAIVTQAGLLALGRTAVPAAACGTDAQEAAPSGAATSAPTGQAAEADQLQGNGGGSAPSAPSAPALLPDGNRPGGKRTLVLSLLQRPEGSTLSELVAVTGWLPHTTRAALTGLRHKGYAVDRGPRSDGAMAYRIIPAQSRDGQAA